MTIIGITGKAGAGKDIIADYLTEYTKLSYAEPLKWGVQQMFGLTDNQVFGNEKDKVCPVWGITPRRILQFVGTELMRDGLKPLIPDSSIWFKRMQMRMDGVDKVVIPDVRFADEAHQLKANYDNVIIIKVVRNSCKSMDHASEKGDVPYDYLVENNGTKEELYKKIDDIPLFKS